MSFVNCHWQFCLLIRRYVYNMTCNIHFRKAVRITASKYNNYRRELWLSCLRSLSCETNAGATEEVPASNQSWSGCNHPTSNWPYQGHQIPYLVPGTTNWLSPLWSSTDHWPYAARVCIVTGVSWWILHSRLIECSVRDNSWDLHNKSSCEKRDSSIWYDVIY